MSNPLAMDFPALAYFCLQAPKYFFSCTVRKYFLWQSQNQGHSLCRYQLRCLLLQSTVYFKHMSATKMPVQRVSFLWDLLLLLAKYLWEQAHKEQTE